MRAPAGRPSRLSLLREAAANVRRRRARAALTAGVVAVAVAIAVATTGRAGATREAILVRLEEPAARIVRLRLDGDAHFDRADVARAASLSSVEWALGLGPVGALAHNESTGSPRLGYARDPVGSRVAYSSPGGVVPGRVIVGRVPTEGEAVAGGDAARTLGLAEGVGAVRDDAAGDIPIVATVAAPEGLPGLGAYVLRVAGPDEQFVELDVLVRRAADVERATAILGAAVAPAAEPGALLIDRAEELLRLQRDLAADIGGLDAALLVGSLLGVTILTGGLIYGDVSDRRREFGLRRTLGASRSDIGMLVTLEALFQVAGGVMVGGAAGTVAVLVQTGSLAPVDLTVALAMLVALGALGGASPAAAVAAFREPILVLRSA